MIQKWPRMSHHLDKQSVRKILRSVNIFLKRKTNVKVKSGKGKDKGKKQKKKKESKNL